MTFRAARLQKRLLMGMPIIWAAAWAGPAGGSLGLLAWAGLCALSPGPVYPYPRKRRVPAARLFFAWAAGTGMLFCLHALQQILSMPVALCLPGNACLACLAAARAAAGLRKPLH